MTVIEGSTQLRRIDGMSGQASTMRMSTAFRCDDCGSMSIGIGHYHGGAITHREAESRMDSGHVEEWLPAKALGKTYEDVPPHIAGAAFEAHACASIGAYRAAGALARAVVEATAKEKGITKGQIRDKIDALYDARLIREHVRDGAHEVRHLGNDMAHGDFVEPVGQEEIDETLELMSEVLNEVFQSPARVERVRSAREAKQQAAKSAQPASDA